MAAGTRWMGVPTGVAWYSQVYQAMPVVRSRMALAVRVAIGAQASWASDEDSSR
jgi:hypothetical protein